MSTRIAAHPRAGALARRTVILHLVVAALVGMVAAAPAVAQTTSTWNGTTGNWSDATIWSTNPFYPNNGNPTGSTYNATVSGSGTITLDVPITIERLTFPGATITGPNSLTLNAGLDWTGGTFAGTGATTVVGPTSITGGLLGRNLTLNGPATWTGATFSGIGFTEGSGATLTINNTFTDATAASIINTQTGNTAGLAIAITSGGAYAKTGSGTTQVAVPFNVAGAVQVAAGTLQLSSGAATAATFTIGSGTTLVFNGTYTADTATSFAGAGTLAVLGGSVSLGGALPATLGLTVSGGAVSGSSDLIVNGGFTWSGGSLAGTGTTTVAGAAAVSNVVTVSRNVNLNGPTTWSGGGTILFGAGATLAINGTFTDATTGGANFNGSSSAAVAIVGSGTYAKTGSGSTLIQVPLTNAGTVSVQAGTLSLSGGGAAPAGTFAIASGATLQLTGNNYTIGSGTSFTGSGTFGLSGIFTGTAAVSGPFASTLAVSAGTGTLAFNGGPYTVAAATVGGTLGGTADLAVSGGLTWSNGTLAGAGATTTVAGTTTITGGLLGRNLTLNGPATWTGGTFSGIGFIEGSGATLTIGGTFTDATTGGGINTLTGNTVGLAIAVTSGGAYVKTGSGTTTLRIPFNNAGAVQVSAGTLSLTAGATAMAGSTFTVSAAAGLDFAGGTFTGTTTINGPFSVSGPTTFATGAITVSGTGTVASTLTVGSAENLSGTGNIQVTSAGNLTVQGTVGVPVTSAGVVNGDATFNSSLTITSGGFVKPGNSPGTITVGGNIKLDGDFGWDINGNDTVLGGTTYGQLKANGNGSLNANGTVKVQVGSGVNFGNAFWSQSATWPVIIVNGGFTTYPVLPQIAFDPTAFAAVFPGGSWSLSEQPTTLYVNWTPGAVRQSTFSMSGDGHWNNPANWNAPPAGGPSAQLVFGPTTAGTPMALVNDIPGTFVLNGLTCAAGSPAYTLTGNGLEFRANSAGAVPQVVSNSTNPVTIGVPLTLTNGLMVGGAGDISITAAIGGPGGLTMAGSGTLTLAAATNSYAGGANVVNGTLAVATDAALGTGNVTGASPGTLSFTGSTTTTKTFVMNGGTIAVAAGQAVTFNGGAIGGAVFDGGGTFVANGARFVGVTSTPSVAVMSTSAADQFVHMSNSGAFTVATGVNAAGTSSTVNFNGFINQGLGSVVVGAQAQVNVANFQSYGTVTINPAIVTENFSQTTLVTNVGTARIGFNGGSRTFIGTPATAVFPQSWPDPSLRGLPTFVAGIDLNGKNAVVAGGLFVNNGYVEDSSNNFQGTATVIADFGSLVKGAGYFQNTVQTINGGKFQAGNSPGKATFGQFVLGPGGVSNYVFAIDDATGAAGPSPDALGHVSGWGLVRVGAPPVIDRGLNTSGDFVWTATAAEPVTVAIETLLNPTTVGVDLPGPMADFDPARSYVWPAVEWTGSYAGPADAGALDAATAFDTSGFASPVAGTFGWSLDTTDHTLSLTYTPSAVPEPGAFVLVTFAAAGLVFRRNNVVFPFGRAIVFPNSL